MHLLSEFSQLMRFLKDKFAFSHHSFTRLAAFSKMAGFDDPWTEILNFYFSLPTLIFCSVLDKVEIIVTKICFRQEKLGPQKGQDLGKATAIAIYPIIVHFITYRALACDLRAQQGCAETVTKKEILQLVFTAEKLLCLNVRTYLGERERGGGGSLIYICSHQQH